MPTKTKRPKGPAHYQQRIIDKVRGSDKTRKDLINRHLRLKKCARPGFDQWTHDRSYNIYNAAFGPFLADFGLRNDILDSLLLIRRGKKTPLRIFEEGPGEGVAVSKLKQMLSSRRIRARTTVVDMNYKDVLGERKLIGGIDDVVRKKAEFFYPKEKQHAIISLFGPTHYTISDLRKDHVLKLAHSLKPGGVMMVGFSVETPLNKKDIEWREGTYNPGVEQKAISNARERASRSLNIPFGLSEDPHPLRNVHLKQEMDGVERAFAKRGFKARFYYNKHWWPDLCPYVLIAQRTNRPAEENV